MSVGCALPDVGRLIAFALRDPHHLHYLPAAVVGVGDVAGEEFQNSDRLRHLRLSYYRDAIISIFETGEVDVFLPG